MLTLDDIFLLLVFLSVVCGALGLGAYVDETLILRIRLRRRMRRLAKTLEDRAHT